MIRKALRPDKDLIWRMRKYVHRKSGGKTFSFACSLESSACSIKQKQEILKERWIWFRLTLDLRTLGEPQEDIQELLQISCLTIQSNNMIKRHLRVKIFKLNEVKNVNKTFGQRYRLFNLPRAENLTSDPTVVPTVLESLISYLNYTLKQLCKVDLMPYFANK